MSGSSFDSIAEAERRAQRTLPKSVFVMLQAGNERGLTRAANVTAFDEIGWLPRIGDQPAAPRQSTTVLGREISLPVVISPTGTQAAHPQGEIAVARAAAARGTIMSLSAFGSKPIEDVVVANPHTLFQVYWIGTRDDMVRRVERARAAGAEGLILTLDWSFFDARDWHSPPIPGRMDVRTMARFAHEALARPRWTLAFMRGGGFPDLAVPNMVGLGSPSPGYLDAYMQWAQTNPPTWEDVSWLREIWGGPFLLKGVMRADDARRAVDAGVTAISVSNHGGNNLDGSPAAVRVLPSIVDAVGGEVEVLMDGGIRRGNDVVKALALGARAVMIGRPYIWGLAAGGQAGVECVLEILRTGIDCSLRALGKASITELSPKDLRIADGFVINQD